METTMNKELYDVLLELICITDHNGRVCSMNNSFKQCLAQNGIDLSGKLFTDLVHVDDKPVVDKQLHLLKSKQSISASFTCKVNCNNNSEKYKWLKCSAIADFNEDRILITCIDITKEKEYQQELELAQDELNLMFNNIPLSIWYKDDQNNILRLNKQAADAMGMSVKDAEGKNTYDLYPEIAAQYHKDDLEVIRSGKAKRGYIEEHIPKHGPSTWVQTSKVPYNYKGNAYVFVVAQDVTELVEANESLRKNEARLSSLFNNSKDHIHLLGTDGTIIDLNRYEEGFTERSVLGRKIYDFFPDNEQRELVKSIVDKVSTTGNAGSYESHIEINGTIHYYDTTVSPLLDRNGNVEFLSAISKDVTQRKQYELHLTKLNEELESRIKDRTIDLEEKNIELSRVNQYLDDFVYTAAHDLRSPIQAMQSLYMLNQKTSDKARKAETMERMGYSIEKLKETLDGLMQVVENRGKNNIDLDQIDIKALITDILEDHEEQLAVIDHHIELNIKVKKVKYIKVYLQSVLQNLISNAIKYRKKEQKLFITIDTFATENATIVKVTDNGTGMDLETIEGKLFTPFQRFNTTENGKGIGLSLIKRIIEKNNGRIEVESSIGKGTTFTVTLNNN